MLARRRGETAPASQGNGAAPPAESTAAPDRDDDEESRRFEESQEGGEVARSQHLEAPAETLLGGRYLVTATLGRGVFATVFRCIDTQAAAIPNSHTPHSEDATTTTTSVAVKVLRQAKDAAALYRAELSVLTALNSSPRHATHNLVRLLDSFQHDQHPCIVVENMQCNLRYYGIHENHLRSEISNA